MLCLGHAEKIDSSSLDIGTQRTRFVGTVAQLAYGTTPRRAARSGVVALPHRRKHRCHHARRALDTQERGQVGEQGVESRGGGGTPRYPARQSPQADGRGESLGGPSGLLETERLRLRRRALDAASLGPTRAAGSAGCRTSFFGAGGQGDRASDFGGAALATAQGHLLPATARPGF